MFQEVGREIATQGLRLSRPDAQTYVSPLPSVRPIYTSTRNKAVAVGAVSHYLDRFIVGRLVRYTYGTPGSVEYDPSDPEHRKRSHKKYLGLTGEIKLDVFSPTLFKVTFSHSDWALGTKSTLRERGYLALRSSVRRLLASAHSLRLLVG